MSARLPRYCGRCQVVHRAGAACPKLRKSKDSLAYLKGWSAVSKRVIARDRGICQICGRSGADTADHIIRRRDGGSDDESNLRAAHRACNSSRH